MQISATMVKELRERTGAGMMDCKKALQEAAGNIDAAIEAMRKSGVAKAAKKAGRIAAEGVILIDQRADKNLAVMLEVNCETDFVAKDENFLGFAGAVAKTALVNDVNDVAGLSELMLTDGDDQTVEEHRLQLVAKLGENISIRRLHRQATASGNTGVYVHGNRIGVLVDVSGGSAELAKDLAMHIAASRPVCVKEEDVPAELLAREREIFVAQAQESGKPPEIIEKMVTGRLNKFLKEITLLGQPFVKDPDQTVAKLLSANAAMVNGFVRYEVGEGIEKKSDNFAEEVMAQAGIINED